MKDHSQLLGELPERITNHVKNDMGRLAFKLLFTGPLFLVREETDNDYGVDICIEALINDGKAPTNIRSHVQLKSSGKEPTGNNSYHYSVKISNLNYMVNHPCSFYAFYSTVEDKIYYKYADDIYLTIKNNTKKKTISINFNQELNNENLVLIHQKLIDTALLFRDIRFKLHEGGFKPGAQLVYGELAFETSCDSFEEYLLKNDIYYIYSMDEAGKIIFLHNIIWESHHGQIPRGYQVYHVNGNSLDNRSDNLDIMKTIDNLISKDFREILKKHKHLIYCH